MIVFLNGEKTNQLLLKEEVISHPEVKAALVVDAKRLEAALLIELTAVAQLSEEEKAAVLNGSGQLSRKQTKLRLLMPTYQGARYYLLIQMFLC